MVLVHDVGMLEGNIGFDRHGRLDDKEFKIYQERPVVKVENKTIDLSLHKDVMITRIIRN